jgi:hypothetical protein
MLWLVTGQIFGLISAMSQLELAQVRVRFPTAFGVFGVIRSSRHRISLLTPALLERLGLDPETPEPRFFKVFMVAVKIFKYYVSWPYRLLALGSSVPEVSFFVIVILCSAIYGFASIWGFIVVGQMLTAYGNCFRVY